MSYDEEPYFQAISQDNPQVQQETTQESFPKRFIFFCGLAIFAGITLIALIIAGIAHNVIAGTYPELNDSNETLTATTTISVYYEVLCADSKAFIMDQLVPVQKKYKEHVNIRFVPFGKARFVEREDNQFQFYCQHGDEECHGNKLHACLINRYDNEDQLKLTSVIACSMNKYKYSGVTINSITRNTEDCRQEYFPRDDNSPIMCTDATELLVKHGNETLGLKPPLTFVPTVAVDGSISNQNTKLRDLDTVVCQAVKKRSPINC